MNKKDLREFDIVETIWRGKQDLGQVIYESGRLKIAFLKCNIDLQQWENNLMSRGFDANHIIEVRRPDPNCPEQKIRDKFLEAPVKWNRLHREENHEGQLMNITTPKQRIKR